MKLEHLLIEDREKTLKEVLKLSDKTEEDLNRDVEILRNWFQNQKHLPEIPNDRAIINFLLMNKFSIEVAKQKLDMFYSMKTILPEIFANKHPRLKHMKELSSIVRVIMLPKLMEECTRVQLFQFKNDPEGKFDWYNFMGHTMNISAIRVNEDVINKDILIYDLNNFTAKHVTKITPVMLKKAILILEKIYSNRLAQIHIANCPTYADILINIAKSILKAKIAARIHVHRGIETLADFIPRHVLPSDYGGEEISLEELEVLWTKKCEEYYDRFDEWDKMKVNESLRPTPLINDDILGFHGNFKKLSVD